MNSRIFKISKNIILSLLAFAVILPLCSCFSVELSDGHVPSGTDNGFITEIITDDSAAATTAATTVPVSPATTTAPDSPAETTEEIAEPIPAGPTEDEIADAVARAAEMINNSQAVKPNDFFDPLSGGFGITFDESHPIASYTSKNGNVTCTYQDGSIIYMADVDGMLCSVQYKDNKYSFISAVPSESRPFDLFSLTGFDKDYICSYSFIALPYFDETALEPVGSGSGEAEYQLSGEYIEKCADLLFEALNETDLVIDVDASSGICNTEDEFYIIIDFIAIYENEDKEDEKINIRLSQFGCLGEGGSQSVNIDGTLSNEFGKVPTNIELLCDNVFYHSDGRPACATFSYTMSSDVSVVMPTPDMSCSYDLSYLCEFNFLDEKQPVFSAKYDVCYTVADDERTDKSVSRYELGNSYDEEGNAVLKGTIGDDLSSEDTVALITFDLSEIPDIPEEVIITARNSMTDPQDPDAPVLPVDPVTPVDIINPLKPDYLP